MQVHSFAAQTLQSIVILYLSKICYKIDDKIFRMWCINYSYGKSPTTDFNSNDCSSCYYLYVGIHGSNGDDTSSSICVAGWSKSIFFFIIRCWWLCIWWTLCEYRWKDKMYRRRRMWIIRVWGKGSKTLWLLMSSRE
jgi:hypothetical protein